MHCTSAEEKSRVNMTDVVVMIPQDTVPTGMSNRKTKKERMLQSNHEEVLSFHLKLDSTAISSIFEIKVFDR